MNDEEFAALQAQVAEYTAHKWERLYGRPVRFIGVIRHPFYPIIVSITGTDGIERVWSLTADLRENTCDKIKYIRKVTPYNWPIDTKVLVWDMAGPLTAIKGYFAGETSLGRPTTWGSGATSWSTCGTFRAWDHAELADENEEIQQSSNPDL